jgi:tRNA-modifying protein YgfZ
MDHQGDRLTTEYEAIHGNAIVVDRSARGRMRFTGAKAGEVLTGLVTNDVLALVPGHGLYAAALSPKGRIIADPRIFAGDGWFLTDVPERARGGWTALIQKFVNPRLSRYMDESAETCAVGIFGPRAATILASVAGIAANALESLPMFGSAAARVAEREMLVARVPDAGVAGYQIVAATGAREPLLADLHRAGAVRSDAEMLDVARVEAGRPEWGVDMDENTIPQEANFDELDAISYSKGCYTGQEVVARVHFRGHVNRHLRGLRAHDRVGSLPSGATLHAEDGAEVGDVRSSVTSPRLGWIALGMVRREVPIDGSLVARWDGGETRVRVTALPFPD